ncbi:MAG: alpha/beta hydrolase [Planctomycetota bacterium]|nr:alpha/beta hydrolase [Planctomycetota bacterium]
MTASLVCLHGWCCEAWHFDPQVEYFSLRHRIVSIPWQARLKDHDDPINLEVAARDIETVCRDSELPGPLVLIGHSMGGMLAAMMASAGRLDIAGIVVIDATWPFDPKSSEFFRSFIPQLETDFPGAVRKFFTQRLERPEDDPAINARVVDGVVQSDPRVGLAVFRDLQTPNRLPLAEEVPVPILGISSSLQFLDRDNLLSHAKDAWYGQIAGSGHHLMLQVPEQLNAMLERFLSRLTG